MTAARLLACIAERSAGFARRHGRPFVTLSYAQSIDGSLAAVPGRPLALSGPDSLTLTHRLRAAHDAVMVGIGTVLSDDPRLTVRHVAGPNPQPIVLDSRVRIPLTCRLLRQPARPVWLAAVHDCPQSRSSAAEAAGARVFRGPADADGRVDLPAALASFAENGIGSIMVEGGVRAIHSLMAARTIDYVAIAIVPRFVGGAPAVRVQTPLLTGPTIEAFEHAKVGNDLVLWGTPAWASR